MSKIQLVHTFADIISLENLLAAWNEFLCGKKNRADVQEFGARLMDNIIVLHNDLSVRRYAHGGYHEFRISDPKPRVIHKASVRDRLLHHAIYGILYPFFDRTFIADSFSCRINKGTHAALDRFKKMSNQVSRNNTRTCWILKCDIKKFFASIDQTILLNILEQYIPDKDIMWLLKNIVGSFESGVSSHALERLCERRLGAWQSQIASSSGSQAGLLAKTNRKIGLPLGNLTSQLLVNIYMNEFDQFVKHKLKARHYIRYADDFVFLSENREELEEWLLLTLNFLEQKLHLSMHPDKIFLKSLGSGIDFLGWIHFADHRVLRSATKRRMWGRIGYHPAKETISSYLGLLKHGNTVEIQQQIGEI